MVAFKGFEITVQSQGLDLPEHKIDNDDPSEQDVITRYIEAKSGVPFSICAKFVGGKHLPGGSKAQGVSYDFTMDGKLGGGYVVGKHPFCLNITGVTEHGSIKSYHRKFEFSDLNIVEDLSQAAQAKDLHQTLQKTGTIEIRVQRFSSYTEVPVTMRKYETALTGSTSIPEKALKGDSKSQFVQLGKADVVSRRSHWKCDYIDKPPEYFAKFVFKYRSRKALEDLHVIERPLPLEERNMADLNRDELEELVGRLRQTENAQASNDPVVKAEALIKAEGSRSANGGSKRERDPEEEEIFRSATTKRARQPSDTGQIAVVDLTED